MVFAGRIADTDCDPVLLMSAAVEVLRHALNAELMRKIPFIGKDLKAYSLDTVKIFHRDARQVGYTL